MDELFKLMIANIPNFVGLVVLAAVLYRINERQMALIEKIIDDCLKDDDKAKE